MALYRNDEDQILEPL